MAQAVSISLSKFTASVQAAVKAAEAKHPKFKMGAPNAVTVSYLIRGFPIPEAILASVTLGEAQAFATDVAAHLAGSTPEAFAAAVHGPAPEGALLSVGRHIICGIPPVTFTVQLEK
ncbi:MAG TPA: hypothetical protein VGR73_19585 [Bryobacteraceae bacterium]|nr:hypothetical protein [Bryobacteraceae bacterium]